MFQRLRRFRRFRRWSRSALWRCRRFLRHRLRMCRRYLRYPRYRPRPRIHKRNRRPTSLPRRDSGHSHRGYHPLRYLRLRCLLFHHPTHYRATLRQTQKTLYTLKVLGRMSHHYQSYPPPRRHIGWLLPTCYSQ